MVKKKKTAIFPLSKTLNNSVEIITDSRNIIEKKTFAVPVNPVRLIYWFNAITECYL